MAAILLDPAFACGHQVNQLVGCGTARLQSRCELRQSGLIGRERLGLAAAVLAALAVPGVFARRRPVARARHAVMLAAEGRKRGPRWAPGAGSSLALQNKSPIDLLKDMDEEVIEEGTGLCYRVIYDNGIGIRDGPSPSAKRTGEDLLKGEVFEVKTEIRRNGRRYFELIDGRGWAFDWLEVEGKRIELVEVAAQLYTIAFPSGVTGINWKTDGTMRFCKVAGFTDDAVNPLTTAGLRMDDVLVMIDTDPVVGMPFGNVLERIWFTSGRQPGSGVYYRVCTKGAYGIGVREDPDINGPRTGRDLIRGTVFEVDDIIETEDEDGKDGLTYLHLADDSGWVFDTIPVDPENPCVQRLEDVDPGCTLTMWRGETDELAQTIGIKFKQDGLNGKPFVVTVIEEGQPIQQISAMPGANLRKTLLDNGFQVYQELRAIFNCNANQLCGTCVLNVVDGRDNLTVMSVNEKRAMSANPTGFRLCCNIDIYGDIAVQLRPRNVRYGGGTS